MGIKLKDYIQIIYQQTQVMNSFYRSPLNQTTKIANQSRSDLQKRWILLKGQPISAVFRFPKSCLENYPSEQKNKTMKKYRSKATMQEKTIELGKIGKQMQQNVRQTIMNQTRTTFSPRSTAKSAYLSKNYNNSKDKDDAFRIMQQQSNKKTLRLLQKAIMQQDRFFYFEEDLLNLHTNKLPILKKEQRQRKKRPLRKMDLQSSKFIQTSRQRPQQNKKIPYSAQLVVVNKQKPEIRGWDTIQLHEL